MANCSKFKDYKYKKCFAQFSVCLKQVTPVDTFVKELQIATEH